jgi:hypothetical protein
MFETRNPPVRPPLRPADAQRPKTVPVIKTPRCARRVHCENAKQDRAVVSEAFPAAKEMAARAANEIRRQFGQDLTREEYQRLVSFFRAGIVPRRQPGRRPKPQVTAAYLDWKAGMRGEALYEKYIPGWKKHHRYRRIGEQKTLMDAIRNRYRRER